MSRQSSRRAAAAASAPTVKVPEAVAACIPILKYLQSKHEAGPFLEPVDWKAFGLLDYPDVIKNPMDLGTIEKRLMGGEYSSPSKFAADIRLIWQNAQTYNRADSEIYKISEVLSRLFEKKMSKIKVVQKRTRGSDGDATREATRLDRLQFAQSIQLLTSDQLGMVVDIVQADCPEALSKIEPDDELEIDVNSIDDATLLQLLEQSGVWVNQSKKRKVICR